ncbi:MAG TPA: hypothetical protein VLA00_16670 [Xanthobacteraceae bacterium]|nr:hypothetical protein [Xanthobacteraceae bacterium]
MVRDPRMLDQNPVVIDPADVDAVLKDEPTPVSNPLRPPMSEVDHSKAGAAPEGADPAKTVDGSHHGTPEKPADPRR